MKELKANTRSRRSHKAGITLLVILVIALLGAGAYAFTRTPLYGTLTDTKLAYSQSAITSETWSTFKADEIEAGSSRTLTDHTSNLTSSRLQSETLLRSVYIDDKATFDASWKWSATNERLQNGLFASQYGPRADGSYGFVSTATDSAGDTNMALALLMAYGRWSDQSYLRDAQSIITALHDNSVATVNGSPVLAASAVDANATTIIVNPATFNPAAFKEFAKVDPSHDWTSLATNTYTLTDRLLQANDSRMPEAATVTVADGSIVIAQGDKLSGPDAFTAVFNLGLDYAWNMDATALTVLKKLPYAGEYAQTGTILMRGEESAATYGKVIPYLRAVAPNAAGSVTTQKLVTLYNQDEQAWATRLSADDSTWAWFGITAYNGALRHLTETRS